MQKTDLVSERTVNHKEDENFFVEKVLKMHLNKKGRMIFL